MEAPIRRWANGRGDLGTDLPRVAGACLVDHGGNYIAVDVGQPKVAAGVAVDQRVWSMPIKCRIVA